MIKYTTDCESLVVEDLRLTAKFSLGRQQLLNALTLKLFQTLISVRVDCRGSSLHIVHTVHPYLMPLQRQLARVN